MESVRASQARDLFAGRGNVLIEVRAVEVERPPEAVRQQRGRLPPERRPDLRRIGVEVADVDDLLLRRPWRAPESARAGGPDHQLDELTMSDGLQSADVERLSVALVAGAGAQK